MKTKLPILILIVICIALLTGFILKSNKLSKAESEINYLDDKIDELNRELDEKESELMELEKEKRDMERDMMALNSYTTKTYRNGILVQSLNGYKEVLEACEKKVKDLEWELMNCR